VGLTVTVNIDGIEHKFKTLASQAQDLNSPLRRFGAYLRKKALERYKAQNFAPLATSTMENRAQAGLKSVERKLHRDLRRAVRRANRKGDPKGLLAQLLGAPKVDLGSASKSRGVQTRLAVLAEFQRGHRRGGDLSKRTDLRPLTFKQLASLSAREQRGVEKAVGKPILGGLQKTLTIEIGPASFTLKSKTAHEWSAVHNEGGSAGHGAKIPKRQTIPTQLDAHELAVFTEILKEHHLLAFEE
jgi:type II secretory pathway component PulJ